MDLLSLPEYVIKKGRPHGHRYGEKPGDKEYYLANQWKKKCKKKKFQGIHDRFLRDHEFRVRMIEHNRDEEVSRRWDVLADEDHTHHLSEKEYFYKNKWWLHLNKSGSDTLPLRKRSDFKRALSTLERLHQEAGEEPFPPTFSYKHKQWQLASSSSSTWWKWQDSWWSSYNSESQSRGKQSLGNERGDPLLTVLWRKPQEMAFKNSICFVTDRSFTVDGGLLQPTGGVKTTPQMTRFQIVQQAIIIATVWIDDDKIKSDYNMKKTWNYESVVTQHDMTSDTNEDVTTKTNTVHMKRDTLQVNVHVVFLLVLFSLVSSSSLIAHHIAWLKLCACLSHLIHACSERHSSTLSSPFHPTFSSSLLF